MGSIPGSRAQLSTDDRLARWVDSALEGELARIRDAGEGGRNEALNSAGFALGRLVGAGAIEREAAAELLVREAVAAGLREREARYTADRALGQGAADPRDLPELGKRALRDRRLVQPAPAKPRPAPTPKRPPRAELEALWAAAARPGLVPLGPSKNYARACAYLEQRDPPINAIEAGLVDVLRVLPDPDAFDYPAWWPSTWASCWCLGAIAYEADGTPASLQARAVEKRDAKTLWPKGCEARGLLFACERGAAFLRGQLMMMPLDGVLIAEGLTCTLAAAIYAAQQEAARGPTLAVLGVTAGAAAALGKVRWPEGVPAYVATDHDPAGEGYAEEIRRALPSHVEALRMDLGDGDAAAAR